MVSGHVRILGLAPLVLVAACAELVSLVPEEFLPVEPERPAIVDSVLEQEASFVARPDDGLAQVVPGTIIDDLTGLDGCWGNVLKQPTPANPLVTAVAVRRFDVRAKTFEEWTYLRDATGSFFILTLERGTFEIASDNRLILRLEERWANDPDTGELAALNADPREFPALVSVQGDQMLFVFGSDSAEGVASEDYAFYLFKRFECVD